MFVMFARQSKLRTALEKVTKERDAALKKAKQEEQAAIIATIRALSAENEMRFNSIEQRNAKKKGLILSPIQVKRFGE